MNFCKKSKTKNVIKKRQNINHQKYLEKTKFCSILNFYRNMITNEQWLTDISFSGLLLSERILCKEKQKTVMCLGMCSINLIIFSYHLFSKRNLLLWKYLTIFMMNILTKRCDLLMSSVSMSRISSISTSGTSVSF